MRKRQSEGLWRDNVKVGKVGFEPSHPEGHVILGRFGRLPIFSNRPDNTGAFEWSGFVLFIGMEILCHFSHSLSTIGPKNFLG